MIKEQYKYSDLTSKIIGCAMEVHNNWGMVFKKSFTREPCQLTMKLQNILHEREKRNAFIL